MHPIPNKEATTVFKCLKKLIGRFGVPEAIISDQGLECCNELNDHFCNGLGISRRICIAYHPQSNGPTKQFNQTICGCLSKFSDGGKLNWEDDLDLILMGYRSSIQSLSIYSPFEIVYGMKARLPIELDLPMHTYQGYECIKAMEKVVINLKIVGEKRIDAHKNIRLHKKGNNITPSKFINTMAHIYHIIKCCSTKELYFIIQIKCYFHITLARML